MTLKNLLLGTSAVVGAALLGAAGPVGGVAQAAEVLPGGALDVTMSGFIRFRAHAGDLDNQRLDPEFARGLDFSNDTEVHVIVRGKHDASGTEYGGTVEFEADTNRNDNTDESWLFLRGGWGEVRLGDEDGVVDNSAIGGQTIAAGTGGIDGSVVDALAIGVVFPTNSNDSTKVRYYTPSFGGFQLGVSYTPNQTEADSGGGQGDSLARRRDTDDDDGIVGGDDLGDIVEGAVVYDGEFGGVGLQASVVGSVGDVKDEDDLGGDDFWTLMGGVATEIFGFKIAGAYGTEEVGGTERDWVNGGVGYGIGPVNVSLTGGKVLDSEGYTANEPYNVVLSADLALMPGLVLAGDVAYFDNDVDGDDLDDADVEDDNGWVWVTRVGLAF